MTGSAGATNTDNNDTFTATQDTYTTNDVIVGGNGTDTLNITATGAVGNASSVVGVENINVTVNGMFSGASYNATGVAGTVALGLSTTQVGGDGAFAVTGLGSGTTTVTAASNVTGALSLTSAGVATQTLVIAANSASAQNVTLQGSGTTDTASVTANGAVTLDTDAAGTGDLDVETVTLAGNTAAATYTLGTITTASNLVLSGAQNVTVSGTSANFTGKTVTDSTTAGTTTVKVTATTSGNDLSKVSSDVIEVSGATAGHDLIFKATGANVTVSTTTQFDLISTSLTDTATTDSITILATGATTLIGNATGGAGGAAGTAGAYETVNYSATVANAAVNTATLTLGAGTALNLSGSNAITLHTDSTAKSINAAALSGALTVNYDGATDIATVTGGSANDTFEFASGYTTGALTIDGGAGTADKITLAADETLSALSLSNIEVFTLASTVDATFKASQLSGKSYVIVGTGDNAGETLVIGTGGGTKLIDTATIDLSGLAIDTNDIASITVLGTDIADSLGAGSALTITGSSTKDIVTGNNGNDVIDGKAGNDEISGGAGNDTITGGEGTDTITGGAGDDTIVLTETTSAVDTVVFAATATANGSDTITGFEFGTGKDKMDFDAFLTTAAAFYEIGTTGTAVGDDGVAATSTGAIALAGIDKKVVLVTTADISTQTVDEATLFGAAKAFAAEGTTAYASVLLVGETSGTDGVKAYYVVDGLGADDMTVTLVGTFSGVSLASVHADNLA